MCIVVVNSVIRSTSMIHPFQGIYKFSQIANLCKLRYNCFKKYSLCKCDPQEHVHNPSRSCCGSVFIIVFQIIQIQFFRFRLIFRFILIFIFRFISF